jgi:hypothetical protein
MTRHVAGALQAAAVLQIGGDAGAAKGVIADRCGDAGGAGAAVDRFPGVGLGQRPNAEPLGLPIDAAE